jgi:hypothetical protein
VVIMERPGDVHRAARSARQQKASSGEPDARLTAGSSSA